MPEFYADRKCNYQTRAQPYLDALARGVRDDPAVRQHILRDTEFFSAYSDADVVWAEQWKRRDPKNSMKGPFWSNYWSEPCSNCDCRIDQSVSMEIDAIFFLRNAEGKTLAIHVEFKRVGEQLSHGQAEAYRPRAECYRDQGRRRASVLPHDDCVTMLLGAESVSGANAGCFEVLMTHREARKVIPGYPR